MMCWFFSRCQPCKELVGGLHKGAKSRGKYFRIEMNNKNL
jgi:hypothetical protein